jgi:hypothetical protein
MPLSTAVIDQMTYLSLQENIIFPLLFISMQPNKIRELNKITSNFYVDKNELLG